MITLTVIQGPDAGRTYELPRNLPQLIGRSTEALQLTDSTISRRHAELTPDGDVWFVRDLHSQNGTFVNGVPIRERIRLQRGDQVRTGATVFVFGTSEPDDPAVVRLVGRPGSAGGGADDSQIDYRLGSSEDSVILAEPEPRAAAVDHLRVIYELTTLTTRIADKAELLRAVLGLVFEELRPERGVVMLAGVTPASDLTPAIIQRRGPPRPGEDPTIEVSRTIVQAALERSEGVLSTNAMADPRFKAGDSVQRYSIRSAICSPIRYREQSFGAIYIDSSTPNYTFTKEQLALLNAIGRHTALALATIDQTQRRVHNERLAAVGEAVASVSHSIKNILQGLRGGADVVEIGFRRDDLKVAKSGWGILKRNMDRIVGLTMNMLAFSRPRALELELVRLGQIADDCAELLADACAEKEVALIVDADPEMPPIHVDVGLIHQALMNLMGNAVEAVEPKAGAVTVRVAFHEPAVAPIPARGQLAPAPWVEIAVIDNGPGIPQDRLNWIFEPFNTTKGIRGTGLGLAVTRRIVAEHRGRIRVETAPGRGAAFRILIPADLDAQVDPSATANNRPSGGTVAGG